MRQTFTLMLALLMLAACSSEKKKITKTVATVKVATVVSAGDTGNWQFPGRVKAGSEINAAFKVAGTIKAVHVKEGQHVASGQLLAEMDDSDYAVQLRATQAEYEQISAEANRVMQLHAQGATTKSNYDKAFYGLQQIESKLKHHQDQVAYCKIYAPEAGTVQLKMHEAGEIVGAGMPIVQLVGSGAPEVEITVPARLQRVFAKTSDAVTATASFTAIPDRTFNLRLLHALPKANASGMYPVRFALVGAELPMPGMNGWVTITHNLPIEDQELRVSASAIVHSYTEDYIFKVIDGKAKRVVVQVNAITGNGMAAVTGNLAEGDQVVVSGVHYIHDGQEIEVLKPAPKTNVGSLL